MATVDSPPLSTSAAPVENRDEKQFNSIQVSMDKSPSFYARIGERMLKGSREKPAYNEVVITGLGMATKTAIGAASVMEKNNAATIKHVETSHPTSTRGKRRVPKLTITLLKTPEEVQEDPPADVLVA